MKFTAKIIEQNLCTVEVEASDMTDAVNKIECAEYQVVNSDEQLPSAEILSIIKEQE